MYVAIESALPFDEWIRDQYLFGGFKKVKTGVQSKFLSKSFVVHGDVVVEIEYSKETLRFLRELFSQMKNLSDLFRFYLHKKLSKHEYHVTVTIQKNPTLAKIISDEVKALVQ